MFYKIDDLNQKKLLSSFNSRINTYKKNTTITTNTSQIGQVGIVVNGTAVVIKYGFDGSRTIVEKLEPNSIFGEIFSANEAGDLFVIAETDCEILFLDYYAILSQTLKSSGYYNQLVRNMFIILSNKLAEANERVDILVKKTIREKLLSFFNNRTRGKLTSTFYLPFSYTYLAEFLGVDRAAMMRELNNLIQEGFITKEKKKITVNHS